MSNTHGVPDTLAEVSAREFDLLPTCIVSTTWPTAPASGLTIAAFATRGYCRRGPDLVYCDQPARAITLPNSAGTYWLTLTTDTHTAMSGYTRIPGSHYAYVQQPSQPPQPNGGLIFASAVVAGGNVTSVTPMPFLGSLAEAWRAWIGVGTLATQNAHTVAITGGTINGLTAFAADGQTLVVDGATHRVGLNIASPTAGLDVNTNAYLRALTGFGASPFANSRVVIVHQKATQYGLFMQGNDGDAGPQPTVGFGNVAGTPVGSINATATGTSFNTTSDRRLKEALQPLADALAAVLALKPVAFRWRLDGSTGQGFVADEVQEIVPAAVTGAPNAVDAHGRVVPQGLDASKLVPLLTAAVQELAARVAALELRQA